MRGGRVSKLSRIMSNTQHGDGDSDSDETHPYYGAFRPAVVFGRVSVILGSVAMVGSLIPILGLITGIVGLAGLVAGVKGWANKDRPKTLAIVGTVLSAIALTLTVLPPASLGDGNEENASRVPLIYTVSAEGGTASVTYATFTEGEPSEETIDEAPLPFAQELAVIVDGEDPFNIFTVRASADAGTMLTCTITLDGEVLDEQTSYDSCTANYLADK
jgi:hypothetical protein